MTGLFCHGVLRVLCRYVCWFWTGHFVIVPLNTGKFPYQDVPLKKHI